MFSMLLITSPVILDILVLTALMLLVKLSTFIKLSFINDKICELILSSTLVDNLLKMVLIKLINRRFASAKSISGLFL